MIKPKIRFNVSDFGDLNEYFMEYFTTILSEFAEVEVSNNPDFLISGVYGDDFLKYNCVRIIYISEEDEPDFNLFDYAIGYSKMVFYDRYLEQPFYARLGYEKRLEESLEKHNKSIEYYLSKRKFCNFIYSNGFADKFRQDAFRALNDYKHVDSAGRFLNNMGDIDIAGSRTSENYADSKIKFMQDYRFTIAFGNAQKPGYADEKVFDAWRAGTIPIFWGDSTFAETFNSKAYIDCTKCKDVAEVVEKVREIEESQEKYLAMQKEPIILSDSKFYEYMGKKRITDFLQHIMLQTPRDAKRISHGIRAQNYFDDYLLMSKIKSSLVYRICKKISVN